MMYASLGIRNVRIRPGSNDRLILILWVFKNSPWRPTWSVYSGHRNNSRPTIIATAKHFIYPYPFNNNTTIVDSNNKDTDVSSSLNKVTAMAGMDRDRAVRCYLDYCFWYHWTTVVSHFSSRNLCERQVRRPSRRLYNQRTGFQTGQIWRQLPKDSRRWYGSQPNEVQVHKPQRLISFPTKPCPCLWMLLYF